MRDKKIENKTFIKYITPGEAFNYAMIIKRLRADERYISADSLNSRMHTKVRKGEAVKVEGVRPPQWIVSQASMDKMRTKKRQGSHHIKRRKDVPVVSDTSEKLWSQVLSMPIV